MKKELHIRDKKRGLVYQLRKIMHHFFPDLFIWLREIEDFRRKSEYELAELITACIAMYLFKNDSRNAFNNLRKEAKFKINYERLFNLKLPHPDTVENILRRLPNDVLEQLKDKMIAALLDKKSLHKYRYQGQWFTVAIDGTGVVSFDEKHCEQCLHSTSKKALKLIKKYLPSWIIPVNIPKFATKLLLGSMATTKAINDFQQVLRNVSKTVLVHRIKEMANIHLKLQKTNIRCSYLQPKDDILVSKNCARIIEQYCGEFSIYEVKGSHFVLQVNASESAKIINREIKLIKRYFAKNLS